MKNPPKFLIAKSFLIATIALNALPIGKVSAASITDFRAGNIMSDAVMRNYTSMSQADIQTFLKSKNPCNDTNTAKANQYIARGYQYHIKNGRFVCLADETFNGKTAAQIIYEAARKYQVNPQVLIVLLQKEQGLITDTWPNHLQYRAATGYGCPSSSACAAQYAGFENQVHSAASLFNTVLNGGWSNYPVGNRHVQYHPNSACGGATINIENKATSALYRYTPYQPNSAALAAGTGVGDSCSSYGNRNFYYYFTTWFGSTQALPTATKAAATTATFTSAPTQQITSNIVIPDGDFILTTPSGKALDIAYGGTTNGANVQIYQQNNTPAQVFHITLGKDGYYTIKNPSSGRVLDITYGSTQNGANIQLYDSNNSCAQKWAIQLVGNRYTFLSACSGKALDVAGGAIGANGANVQLYQSNGTAAQSWNLISLKRASVADGKYSVLTPSNLSLFVDGGSKLNGANVKIWTATASGSNLWQFSKGTDGFYTIKNPQSNKVLDAAYGGTTNGTNVQLYDSNNTCAQKWIITRSNGFATIKNACSGLALDVSYGAISTRGTNVQLYTANKTDAQKWTLTKR